MNATILLNNQFQIIRELGAGGFGKTYLAEADNHKRCVIKEFAPSQGNDSEQATQLFRKEAERLKEVGQHSQIPEFYDFFEENNKLFIVQEYIPGDSLQQLLQQGQQFTEQEIESLLLGTLPLLRYLHTSGVIHRDIKPANIIRRQSDGAWVLVDFGAAKRVSETVLAKTGTMIGSVGYASTEQMRGKTSFPSDLFSLGMTCIHLLTGTHPMSIAADPMTGALQWRLELAGKPVREEFAVVLDKMIDDVLGRRFQTADSIIQALKEADATEIAKKGAAALAKVERRSTLVRWGKRSVAAIASAAVIGGIGYGAYTQREAISGLIPSTPQVAAENSGLPPKTAGSSNVLSIGFKGLSFLLIYSSVGMAYRKMQLDETDPFEAFKPVIIIILFTIIGHFFLGIFFVGIL